MVLMQSRKRKSILWLGCVGQRTAAGGVVCGEQQRRRAEAPVCSHRVGTGVRAATILKFTFVNIWAHTSRQENGNVSRHGMRIRS